MLYELGFGTLGSWLMTVTIGLFALFVVVGIVALARYLWHTETFAPLLVPPDDHAERLLARRFARGHIDAETYVSLVEVLRGEHRSRRRDR